MSGSNHEKGFRSRAKRCASLQRSRTGGVARCPGALPRDVSGAGTGKRSGQHDLARARERVERRTQDLAAERRELEQERTRAQRERDTAAVPAASLKDVHRSLYSGNIYELALKTCITLTQPPEARTSYQRARTGRGV